MDPAADFRRDVSALASAFEGNGDMPALQRALAEAAGGASATELAAVAEEFRARPEIAGPLFERLVAISGDDARALVGLANAYWLTGRGPEVVSELASRALAADPSNRAAWHLWALSEPRARDRIDRWQQVARRFPDDDLALANLADNAAAVAGAESDARALGLALATYETLLARATRADQRSALERALEVLRAWRL